METLAGYLASEIIAALFELELAGLVRQLPGKSFIKVWAGLKFELRSSALPGQSSAVSC